jgi:hypothetical protein
MSDVKLRENTEEVDCEFWRSRGCLPGGFGKGFQEVLFPPVSGVTGSWFCYKYT